MAELKNVLSQVKSTGFSIQPLYFDNNKSEISITYQNRKKDFKLIINNHDGGYIAIGKDWEF